MADPDYWKKLYQQSWERASARERAVIERIKRDAGRVAVPSGFGAGSTTYLSGAAADWGHERGAADLQVVGTTVYLEITGPQQPSVPLDAPLWIRPDKIASARAHYAERETWIVHWLEQDDTLRVIYLNGAFFAALERREFVLVTPLIRGVQETYWAIPAAHPCVQPWSALIAYLGKL